MQTKHMCDAEFSQSVFVLETILWDSGYHYLDKHLQRLSTSARYLNYPFSSDEVMTQLLQQSTQFSASNLYKLRLLLNHRGHTHLEVSQIQNPSSVEGVLPTVSLSSIPTDSRQWFYYHKTTHRPLYDRATHFARKYGYADIIFLNERGEITEGAISNIYIQKKEYFFTPPLSCGVLNGIYRQHMLETQMSIKEEILYPEDLFTADSIYISNAIRGLRQVKLTSPNANTSLRIFRDIPQNIEE